MAFDVGAVRAEVTADISNFKKGISEAKNQTNGLKSALGNVGQTIATVGKQAAIFTGVVGAGLTVVTKKALEMAGNFEQSEIAFTTLLKDREKAIAAIKEIEKEAKATPYNLPDLIKANQLLISAGVNTEDARDQIRDLGNAIAATGGGTAELNRLAVNMQQIKAVGKASALDIKQFAFAGINIYKLLSETTGKTVEQVKEMPVTYELLTEALADASKEGGMFEGAMEAQSKSLQGLMSNLEDVIGITLKDIAVESGIFDLMRDAIGGLVVLLEDATPKIIAFLKGLQQNEGLQNFLKGLVAAFTAFSKWVADNQELVLAFLKGVAVALGALLIIGAIAAAVAALTNPLVLLGIAIAALFTAWETNFLGIRDITKTVIDGIIGFFNEYLKPLISGFIEFSREHWDDMLQTVRGTWDMVFGYIKLVWALIYGLITVGLKLLTGDWAGAWEQVKKSGQMAWDAIKQMFEGAIEFIKGWGGMVKDQLTKPFREAWENIKETVEKIKNKLDFTKRESPSVVDVINRGVREANLALSKLKLDTTITPQTAALAVGGQGAGTKINQITVDMGGAIVGDLAQAEELGERIGDSIIKKLQLNVRI